MTPLRQRMVEDMRVRNMSPHTIDSYVRRVRQFAKHFGRSPEKLGPEHVRSYLVHFMKAASCCMQVLRVLARRPGSGLAGRDRNSGPVFARGFPPTRAPIATSGSAATRQPA
jgi:hypothetical protein